MADTEKVEELGKV